MENDITTFRTAPVWKKRGERDERGREGGGGPEGIGIGEWDGWQEGPWGWETKIVVGEKRGGEERAGGGSEGEERGVEVEEGKVEREEKRCREGWGEERWRRET